MIEDDIYRSSTQYRYWSYTPTQLQHLRQTTNNLASKSVTHAIQKVKGADANVSTLSVEEELRIVDWGCQKIIEIGDSIRTSKDVPVPMEIRCTAIQYLRRFYLTNSPMTYHPKNIMACALYLATKSSHWHTSIERFVAELEGVTAAMIRQPEFLLMQGLRFTLDVKHPVKGLEGGQIELVQLSRDKMIDYSERKIGEIMKQARDILRGPAQMTDVYFLYTPSQIWLSALQIVDPGLLTDYMHHKIAGSPNVNMIKDKILATVTSCTAILSSYHSPDQDQNFAKEMRRIGKKLHLCSHPEKVDIVAATAESKVKREGDDSERDQRKAKKRKLERELREKDAEVFGGELRTIKN